MTLHSDGFNEQVQFDWMMFLPDIYAVPLDLASCYLIIELSSCSNFLEAKMTGQESSFKSPVKDLNCTHLLQVPTSTRWLIKFGGGQSNTSMYSNCLWHVGTGSMKK
ncbi:hypothetical protein NMG60_11008160 [Bertholletia excelsa]